MGDFRQEGFALTYRGEGTLTQRMDYFLSSGSLPHLLPVYHYRENLEWVFEYDLEVGYSLGELQERGEGLVTLSLVSRVLGCMETLVGEYFLEPEGFLVGMGSVFVSHGSGELLLVYCPLYRGDFMGDLVGLFGLCFNGEGWFASYMEGLAGLGSGVTLGSYRSLVDSFLPKDPGVDGKKILGGLLNRGDRVRSGRPWVVLLGDLVVDWVLGTSYRTLGILGVGVFLLGLVFGFLW